MAYLTQAELQESLDQAARTVPVGSIWHHYRDPDHTYTIVSHVIMESDDEPGVVYQANYGKHITFVRALTIWTERVQHEGTKAPRFTRLPS